MAKPELILSISNLSKKIDNLLQENKRLKNRVKEIENQNNELLNQHKSDLILLNKAQKEIEFLSVSHRLADSPEALVSARLKIAQLIRTIDSCIRMLNED